MLHTIRIKQILIAPISVHVACRIKPLDAGAHLLE